MNKGITFSIDELINFKLSILNKDVLASFLFLLFYDKI